MLLRPLLIAIQFLTRCPVRLRQTPAEAEMGQAVLYFPLAGVLIGLVMLLVIKITGLMLAPAWLAAALVLTSWVLCTGGLHLDGLADSVDAWAGGRGDRERTLRIMKDPTCGAMGVIAIVLVLLLKFTALVSLLSADQAWRILIAPVLGRTVLPLLFLSTPYARADGLGAAMAAHLPRKPAIAVIVTTCVAMVLLFGMIGLITVFVGAMLFILLKRKMISVIGGMTGDTAGAAVEMMELMVLLSCALCYRV